MFRKIVANLSFSPALVGQLGFYAKRLKKEEATRRAGLVFTALALVVQSFAVFSPPQAANAASPADFVQNGVSSPADFVKYYDRNSNNIKDIFSSLGITRAELKATKLTVIGEASRYNWSMTSLYSHAEGQRAYKYDKASGGEGTVYYRPMRLTQQGGDRHQVFAGMSKEFGWFAIKKDCGNLITAHPPVVLNPEAFCKKLTVAPLVEQTRFRITTKAKKKDGASIRKYEYVIKNEANKAVDTLAFKNTTEEHSFVYTQAKAGSYTVKAIIYTSEGKDSDPNCKDAFIVAKAPAASCIAASAVISDRTIVSLSGSAKAVNKATISKYTFVITDESGKVVERRVVTSSNDNVVADSFDLPPGAYKVVLTVTTSVGDKTSANCQKEFTIEKLQLCVYNPELPADDPECQPCPGNPELWINDEQCSASLISTKAASNLTQGSVEANSVVARSSDKISYTISVQNKGFASTPITLTEELADVLEYAKLLDFGGATFDENTKTLSWAAFDLKAGEKQSRTFAVQMLSDIPATNTGTSDEASYDCTMVNTFGNSVAVDVECPEQKVIVEQVVKELPETGPRENMIFAGVLLAVVVYFYARSRQMNKEIRLVRHELNSGTI